jgi:hypothetical protein
LRLAVHPLSAARSSRVRSGRRSRVAAHSEWLPKRPCTVIIGVFSNRNGDFRGACFLPPTRTQ